MNLNQKLNKWDYAPGLALALFEVSTLNQVQFSGILHVISFFGRGPYMDAMHDVSMDAYTDI